jgi:hypothetical protein
MFLAAFPTLSSFARNSDPLLSSQQRLIQEPFEPITLLDNELRLPIRLTYSDPSDCRRSLIIWII